MAKAFEGQFGEAVWGTDRSKKVCQVALRFHISEASYIDPVDSKEFENLDHLAQFLTSGSSDRSRCKCSRGQLVSCI